MIKIKQNTDVQSRTGRVFCFKKIPGGNFIKQTCPDAARMQDNHLPQYMKCSKWYIINIRSGGLHD